MVAPRRRFEERVQQAYEKAFSCFSSGMFEDRDKKYLTTPFYDFGFELYTSFLQCGLSRV